VACEIVVIGGSAGALEAASRIIHALPPDFGASILIALHRAPYPATGGDLAAVLSRAGRLRVVEPIGRTPLERGRIYLAAADHQLLVEPGIARGVRGPHEHRLRPAIDPLFRSAAVAYGARVAAVLLSGTGSDGTIGLWYVRDRGGVIVVQDPQEAQFRSMPEHAARYVDAEHTLPVESIGPLLVKLAEGGASSSRGSKRGSASKDEDES
jgi:two-component system chemotaxis response regulator CheB